MISEEAKQAEWDLTNLPVVSVRPMPLKAEGRFDDLVYIAACVIRVPEAARGGLSTTLRYLYTTEGKPLNLPRKTMKTALPYLGEAERVLVRWLYTRTNGSLRKTYGVKALLAARRAKYRCVQCGWDDVRVLQLDHIDGRRNPKTGFDCLCANCHTLKSRAKDWQQPGAGT